MHDISRDAERGRYQADLYSDDGDDAEPDEIDVIGPRSGWTTPFLLPPISKVVIEIGRQIGTGEWFHFVGLTLYRAFTGWMLAVLIGVPLGILMARSRLVNWFFDPIISIGMPMPKIAFLPVFIL